MEFNKTSIMALRPQSDDAHDLTRWLEKGAFEAIREKYLERLVLVIFEGDPRGSEANVIEEHSFRVCYPANSSGKAELEHTGQDTKQGQVSSRAVGKGTKDAVKKECVASPFRYPRSLARSLRAAAKTRAARRCAQDDGLHPHAHHSHADDVAAAGHPLRLDAPALQQHRAGGVRA